MMIRARQPDATIRRVASIPSMLGMRTSMRTTSGRSPSASPTASPPSPASPTTSMSSLASRIMRKPPRTSAWSSAITIRTLTARAPEAGVRGRGSRRQAAVRLERAAEQGCPLPHPRESVAAALAAPLWTVRPSSRTSSSTASAPYRTVTSARVACAWRTVFVRASWTTR
jgi:hypothetical protein